MKKPIVYINTPKQCPTFSVYRLSIFHGNSTTPSETYVGMTKLELADRVDLHITTKGRRVYDAYHQTHEGVMVVEHLEGARTEARARELEKRHITRERTRVGDSLLNVQHNRPKKQAQ